MPKAKDAMKPIRLVLLLALGVSAVAPAAGAVRGRQEAAAGSVLSMDLRPGTHELEIQYKGQRLLTYAFAPRQFKPYVRELYSLRGQNVLLDAPPDHLHHHGLMYAVKVNGINFWEEATNAGWQRPLAELSRRVGRHPAGSPQAEFAQTICWVAGPDGAAPNPAAVALLVEQRTITVTVQESAEEVALEWRSDFAVGPASPRVTLTGAVYHGLGVRFALPFNLTARRQNSARLPYSAEGKQDITPASWASVSHPLAGQDITLTVFDHPDNAAEPRFFSMLNPFTYLSATQGLDAQPLEYGPGATFSLRYLITVHGGTPASTWLEQRSQRWRRP
jgi:hypothetical protein